MSSDKKSATTIDDLPEDVLFWEIFTQIHNPRDLLASRSVNKYWNSSLTSPAFSFDLGFALIVNTPAPNQSPREPHYATNDISFKRFHGFKLNYLHYFSNSSKPKRKYFNRNSARPICVQASFQDVLLCTQSYTSQSIFYLVNPVTTRWIRLPETPFRRSNAILPVGLVAHESVYKVMKMTCAYPDRFQVEIFDSGTCTWYEKFVHHEQTEWYWAPTNYQSLAFRGVLHWLANDGPVFAYDPRQDRDAPYHRSRLIHRCPGMDHKRYPDSTVTECLTVSSDRLQVIQLIVFPTRTGSDHLSVWTLTDYNKSTWGMEHRIYFKEMVSDTPWIQHYMHDFAERRAEYKMIVLGKTWAYPEDIRCIHVPRPLASHPNNPNLVYLHLPHCIASCHLSTKKLEIVSKISTESDSHGYDTVVPITLRLEPSPIPFFTATQLYRSGLVGSKFRNVTLRGFLFICFFSVFVGFLLIFFFSVFVLEKRMYG